MSVEFFLLRVTHTRVIDEVMNDAAIDPPDDSWSPLRCAYCAEPADGEEPCSEECEQTAVRETRKRRIEGIMLQAIATMTLSLVYFREGVRNDWRHTACLAEVDDLNDEVRRLSALTVRGEEVANAAE